MKRPGRKGSIRMASALAGIAAAVSLGLWTQGTMAQPPAPAQRIAAVPAAAAGGGASRVAIVARDFSFAAPATVSTGTGTFAMQNQGAEPHHAQFVRLNDGVTLDQFGAALMEGEAAAFPLVSFAGGPGTVDPGGSAEVVLDLTAGQYLMLCFIAGEDNVPHLAKGMIQPFQVGPPPSTAQAPPADGEVIMRDFSFDVPQIQAGQRTLRVVNEGPQPHEMAVIRAEAPLPQVIAALMNFEEEPPFPVEDAGGLQAIDAGKTAWVNLNFTPGSYVLLCFVPDPATGQPHVALGMVAPFEVR